MTYGSDNGDFYQGRRDELVDPTQQEAEGTEKT